MPSLRLVLLLVGLLVAGCDSMPNPVPEPVPDPVPLTVLNRTLARGADLATVFSGSDTPAAKAFALYSDVIASNFPDRARRLAREIEERDPDVVTLQEVLTTRTQFPSDADGVPATPNADRVTFDFLTTLLDSLSARGIEYRVASETETWDIELAADGVGDAVFDVRFTERAVVLVRDTLTAAPGPSLRADGARFLDLPSLREPVGAASARVTVGTSTVTVASARFDADPDRAAAFAQEVLSAVGTGPLAVGGSTPEAGDLATLGAISRTGLTDAWREVGDGDDGTCCIGADFRAFDVTFDRRTDAVWTRDGRAQAITRFSTTPGIRTPSGLWPSSRAGLFARLILGREPTT